MKVYDLEIKFQIHQLSVLLCKKKQVNLKYTLINLIG